MRLALDTNRFRDLADGVPETLEILEEADEVIVPFVVIAELSAGFRHGSQRKKNEALLARFLQQPDTRIEFANAQTVDLWATLDADLLRRGRRMPQNDVWIAALCVQHGLRLYTRNTHFEELPQVMRV